MHLRQWSDQSGPWPPAQAPSCRRETRPEPIPVIMTVRRPARAETNLGENASPRIIVIRPNDLPRPRGVLPGHGPKWSPAVCSAATTAPASALENLLLALAPDLELHNAAWLTGTGTPLATACRNREHGGAGTGSTTRCSGKSVRVVTLPLRPCQDERKGNLSDLYCRTFRSESPV